MAGENPRTIDNEVDTVPQGFDGQGTITVNAVVDTVINGTGTKFELEIGVEPNVFIFVPGTTPPQLLQVQAVNGDEWIKIKKAPSVAVTNQAYKFVFATLKQWGLLNKGNTSAYLNGNSTTGVEIQAGQTEEGPQVLATGNSGYIFKDAIFVDASGTIVEVFEQP